MTSLEDLCTAINEYPDYKQLSKHPTVQELTIFISIRDDHFEKVRELFSVFQKDYDKQRKQLSEVTEGMILGQPAIFPYVETEFEKGYSKGYYGAKEQVEEKLKELLEASVKETDSK